MPSAQPGRVVVIGAGAAGMIAAIFAAEQGAETLLLERTRDGGRKILISGGGRCNILPARVDIARFHTDSSPHTLRNILNAWPLEDQRRFFEATVGIPLVEETASAKLFPASHRARDVRDGLLTLARARGVRVVTGTEVTEVIPTAGGWRVACGAAAPIEAPRVILATGGLSVPTTGSDGFGLALARRLGHTVHPTYPALTPVTADAPAFTALAGISLPVRIVADDGVRRAEAHGGFLFTHRGYSGPAVLDVSHVLVRARLEGRAARLTVQWTSEDAEWWEQALTPRGAERVGRPVKAALPERLALALLRVAEVEPDTPAAQLRRDARRRLVDALTRCALPWNGDEGYRKAEVTGGGVDLGEIHPRTMESRRCPGLFFAGEVLDAFGPIGGYNFLWAWATGRAAGIGSGSG